MNEKIRSILACPSCRGRRLDEEDGRIACRDCGQSYPIVDGIPIFLDQDLDDFKRGEAEYHSEIAGTFDQIHRLDQLRNSYYHDQALQHIEGLPEGALVLELAGGVGHDAQKLMKSGMNVVETDIALECVRETRDRASASELPRPGRHATYMVTDVERLPFAPGAFDAVYICAAWHHLPDPLEGLRQMRACVKPDGLVVISMEPNAWPYYLFYPIVLPLFWKVVALGRLITRPREFFRTSRFVRRAREKLGGENGPEPVETVEREESPGDQSTRGFSQRRIRRLLEAADLELVEVQRVFYVNGWIQEVPYLCQIDLALPAERRLIALDEGLRRTPVLKHLNWFWNIVARRAGPPAGAPPSVEERENDPCIR